MNILKGLFKQKEQPIKTNQDFWDWFVKHEREFFEVVKNEDDITENFFDHISPKLNELKEGFYFLTGMPDDDTVELVLTADGAIEHIAFVEDLIADAPKIDGWLFTALKPALDIKDVYIDMAGYKFTADNISFYAEQNSDYPDEITIKITHAELNEENREAISMGIYIFLDNFLGELNFATTVDDLTIITTDEAESELIPIERLKSYLIWREKEFIEKYEGIRHDTKDDRYASFTATTKSGQSVMGVVNGGLMQWDAKASHPWIAAIELKYDGADNNGMPNNADYELLNKIEEELMLDLKDSDGYLNLARETGRNERMIYFACKDFRLPSKVLYKMQSNYQTKFDISYSIYKDKYWSSLERFTPQY